ncbi:MAG: hypothetical protein EPO10_25895 [Reyranella sp.]|uniref:hypothetical protein n=1 Tax=Reyranella sp. TaxID=1929291 RepID=UPI00121589B8|nr:hypothetical protein [Reyranella sp.]TAJ96931.1 MAG: hypothetical protein EPO41_05255 [Reyranella sp.]TBR24147.1 MAG: hypothetical protein EPO10_25895 [Reyranella sp.]
MDITLHIAHLRCRTSRTPSTLAGPERHKVSRLGESVGGMSHAVVGWLRALDKRMTENLDRRARYMLHGDDPGQNKRR